MAVKVTASLRAKQRAGVRATILDALGRLLAQGSLEDVSFARVAEQAGVSERTVYRYFPNRQALVEGLASWARDEIGEGDPPGNADELPESARCAFRRFEEHELLGRALLATELGVEIRDASRRRRLRQLHAALRPALRSSDPVVARHAEAIVALLYSARTWQLLRDESGLTSAQAGDAVAWAIENLLAAATATTTTVKEET